MEFNPLPSPNQFSTTELHDVDHYNQLIEEGPSVVPHHKQLKKFSKQFVTDYLERSEHFADTRRMKEAADLHRRGGMGVTDD